MIASLTSTINAGVALTRVIDKQLVGIGLSLGKYRLLSAVSAAAANDGAELKPTHIAALLMLEPHSVSGMLNRLEAEGLITRRRFAEDKRSVYINLTPAGRAKLTIGAAGYELLATAFQSAIQPIPFDDETPIASFVEAAAVSVLEDLYPFPKVWRREALAAVGAS